MQIRNTSKLDFASCDRSIQKSKHWNFKDRNVHKLATYSSEHAARQDHAMQSS